MRFLVDTNVLIKLEPNAPGEVEADALLAARLNQLLTGGGHTVLVHPAIEHDIARDDDTERQARNRFLFIEKYCALAHPPPSTALEQELGSPAERSNDWVDLQLIAAVAGNAVHYLVTQDESLIRKMRRVGIADRGLTIADAVQLLSDLYEHEVPPPPTVTHVPMYALRTDDPIWESFRADYEEFDEWYARSAPDARPAWFIGGEEGYEGVCIAKAEDDRPHGLEGHVLKICSFKVAETARGSKLGELLLKTIFRYASESARDAIYVEVLPTHQGLVSLFEDFGFSRSDVHSTSRGELVLIKPLRPGVPMAEEISPFQYHRTFGPPSIHPNARLFVVPILPVYHRLLFPDAEASLLALIEQHPRLPGFEVDPSPPRPFGNAIKKAYLSHSPSRQLSPGDGLLFYRSNDLQAITTLGVVESTLVSDNAQAVAAYVGARTVYSYEEIDTMRSSGPVLAILFRHDRSIDPVSLHDIIAAEALAGAPQSITQVREKGLGWARALLDT